MRSLLRAFGAALALWLMAAMPAGATVTSTVIKVVALCNSVTTNFNFPFIAVAPSDVVVTLTDSTGVSTVQAATNYTLTINPPASNSVWGVGGTVVYPNVGSPCPTGATLTIARNLPYIQTTPFATLGANLPTATETSLDILTMQVQQLNAQFSGALVQPLTDTQAFSALPGAAARANLALCFDATGYVPTACSVPASGTVSSAMQPVVSAGSLAGARTALGLGSAAVENIGSYGMADDGAGKLRQSFVTTQVSTNQAIAGANHLTNYIATGPITFTLPRSNTLWNGFGFWVNAFTGAITLTPDAHDQFQLQGGPLASGTSTPILQGQQAFIFTDGATSGNWYIQFVGSDFSTGDVKMTLKAAADPGWVLMNDGTIGNAGSVASTRANADCFNLFVLLWSNVSNTFAPVSGGRGASALADWNANKTIQLLSVAGRALAGAGSGSGLSARALGQNLGEETHLMTLGELVAHTHSIPSDNATGHTSGPGAGVLQSSNSGSNTPSTNSAGSSTPFNQMQPTVFFNVMVHL